MHAIITGGSSGIGLATARLLAERGAVVSLLARGADRLASAAESLRAGGATVYTRAADVADQAGLTAALSELIAAGGPCDTLVTSAGLARPGRFLELPDDVFRQMIEVDYFGTLYALRSVVPGMVERGRGSVVAVSSAAGLLGIYGYSAYGPAKFAVRGLMESLRAELNPHGVHVGVVYPPDVDTPQLAEENQWKPAETRGDQRHHQAADAGRGRTGHRRRDRSPAVPDLPGSGHPGAGPVRQRAGAGPQPHVRPQGREGDRPVRRAAGS
jgi:3-dehydrosphinganine reductase